MVKLRWLPWCPARLTLTTRNGTQHLTVAEVERLRDALDAFLTAAAALAASVGGFDGDCDR